MSSSTSNSACGNVIYLDKTIKVLRTFDKSLWFFWTDSVIGKTKSSNSTANGSSGSPSTSVSSGSTGSPSTTTNPATSSSSTVENNDNSKAEGTSSGSTPDEVRQSLNEELQKVRMDVYYPM